MPINDINKSNDSVDHSNKASPTNAKTSRAKGPSSIFSTNNQNNSCMFLTSRPEIDHNVHWCDVLFCGRFSVYVCRRCFGYHSQDPIVKSPPI